MANIITLSRIFLAFIAMGLLFLGDKFAPVSVVLTVFVMWFDGLDGCSFRDYG